MDTLLELIKLAGVGLIAGLFSSMLSNHDHRHRTWWEMRVKAYQDAIEALSDLVYYYDTHYRAEIEHREFPDEFKKELEAFWEPAFHKIRKAADSGAFIFSEKANEALAQFLERDDDDPNVTSFMEHVDNRLAAARECLGKLVTLSKADLKLAAPFWERYF